MFGLGVLLVLWFYVYGSVFMLGSRACLEYQVSIIVFIMESVEQLLGLLLEGFLGHAD